MCTWSFLPHIRGVRGRKRLGGSPGGQRDSRKLRAWTRELQGQGPQQQASWTKAWWQRQEPAWTCSPTESPQVWRRAIGKFTGSDRAAAPEAKYRKRVRQPFQPHPTVHKATFHTTYPRFVISEDSSEKDFHGAHLEVSSVTKHNSPLPPQPPGSWALRPFQAYPAQGSQISKSVGCRGCPHKACRPSLPLILPLHFSPLLTGHL